MSASSTCSSSAARPVALVTGASRGIGREVAALLAERGHRVLGTSRAPRDIPAAERLPGVEYVPLDLDDNRSIERCVESTGPIDVLVNNAGRSQLAPLEHVSSGATARLFATNVFGPIQLTRLYLPQMRRRGGGSVIAIGSLICEFPVPFQSTYAASKLALEGFMIALRTEVRPFGIRVALVQPGDVRTNIQDHLDPVVSPDHTYAEQLSVVRERARRSVNSARDPRAVAEKVYSVILKGHPGAIYYVGEGDSLMVFAKRFLPRRLVERLVARRYGL
jgi:short-subunit dehydrogenase